MSTKTTLVGTNIFFFFFFPSDNCEKKHNSARKNHLATFICSKLLQTDGRVSPRNVPMASTKEWID